MDDYYAPHPRLTLPRPVIVTALDFRPARQLVSRVGSRLGLNITHHPERVQHLAGAGYDMLLGGRERLVELEQQALEYCLDDRPAALISLPGRLATASLSERADLILLTHPPLSVPNPIDAAITMGVERDVPGLMKRLASLDAVRFHARPEKKATEILSAHLERLAGVG